MSVQDAGVQESASPEIASPEAVSHTPGEQPAPTPAAPTARRLAGIRARLAGPLRQAGVAALLTLRTVLSGAFGIGLVLALVNGGLDLASAFDASPVSAAAEAPRRPPVIPPMVPQGARRDWAMFSYVEKINQAWGYDWPMVIRLFEDFDARYPGEPMVKDKLYASYIEDGRILQWQGDLAGARRRYEQAARFDPSRPEAGDFLAQLEKEQGGR